MHLTRLSVQGFRSLKDITWEPGKLNVVIGPNGSGKTNIIRLLELLSESAQGHLEDHIKYQGGANALLWDGLAKKIENSIGIEGIHPDCLKIIEQLKINIRITTKETEDLIGIPRSTVKSRLSELVNKGILVRNGLGRGSWYSLRTSANK